MDLDISYEPLDYQRLGDALPDVIKLLDTAMDILGNSVQMPRVEPDDPAWDMFWLRPYSDTAAHLFSQIFDTAEAAEKLMNRINADVSE